MKKTFKTFISIFALFGLQSCGIITQTRYGNGIKLNLSSFSKKENLHSNYKQSKSVFKPQFKLICQGEKLMIIENLNSISTNKKIATINSKSFTTQKTLQNHHGSIPNIKISNNKQNFQTSLNTNNKKKIEPHVKVGGILFYTSILSYVFLSFFTLPVLASIMGISLLSGIVLTLIGKKFLKKNPDQFRGSGLMWSVLITCSLFLLLTFINLAFLFLTLV